MLDSSAAIVKVRLLSGELQQARREHPTVFKNPIASPLGFSDVIVPGRWLGVGIGGQFLWLGFAVGVDAVGFRIRVRLLGLG